MTVVIIYIWPHLAMMDEPEGTVDKAHVPSQVAAGPSGDAMPSTSGVTESSLSVKVSISEIGIRQSKNLIQQLVVHDISYRLVYKPSTFIFPMLKEK